MSSTYDTTEHELLQAILNRLRAKVEWCTESTCILTASPVPNVFPAADPICTVCLGDSQFDQALWSGGGAAQLTEYATVIVTPMARCKLDSPPKYQQALLHAHRGLFRTYKTDILKALFLADDTCADYPQTWQPLDSDGNQIMRDFALTPISSSPAQELFQSAEGREWLGLEMMFRATFDWTL
jgi:hypothetical protein